jgi:hypothetical protein
MCNIGGLFDMVVGSQDGVHRFIYLEIGVSIAFMAYNTTLRKRGRSFSFGTIV